MSKVLVEESNLTAIASAIRTKLGVQTTYKPGQMATAIGTIHGEPALETLTANANGTYTPSTGKDGFSAVTVNVPNSYATGDEGKVVSSGALVTQTSRSVTENGTYDTTANNQVVVNVSGGGSAPEYFTLTKQSNVSSYSGTCVKYGNHAIIDIQINCSSTSSVNVHILTIPEGYRPAGVYYGYSGNGGNLNNRPQIKVNPDGKIYASSLYNLSYLFIHLEWDVPDQIVSITSLSSKVTSITGGIAVCGSYASLSVDLNMTSGSNSWETLFTIPETVRPDRTIRSFIYTLDSNEYVRDSNYSNGDITSWRSTISYDNSIHVQASWLIGE